MKKKIISVLLASMMVIGLVGCGGSKETADGAKSDSGDGLIKVGIINNDPNESGYRTANDKDLKARRLLKNYVLYADYKRLAEFKQIYIGEYDELQRKYYVNSNIQ